MVTSNSSELALNYHLILCQRPHLSLNLLSGSWRTTVPRPPSERQPAYAIITAGIFQEWPNFHSTMPKILSTKLGQRLLRQMVRRVACPKCGAASGDHCLGHTRKTDGVTYVRVRNHRARWEAYLEVENLKAIPLTSAKRVLEYHGLTTLHTGAKK